MRDLRWVLTLGIVGGLTACARDVSPTQPSPAATHMPTTLSLEAEAGRGDGRVVQRSRASGGWTVHLDPGERREWTFSAGGQYAATVTYSNSRGGDSEVLTLKLDGVVVSSFQTRDSGEGEAGWNVFVTDRAGESPPLSGTYTLVVESSGGDGCVEIDLVRLTPANGSS